VENGSDQPRSERSRAEAQIGFFHEQMAGLYGPIFGSIEAFRAGGDTDDAETMVRFLEADIYCDRSGYVTADVIQAIRRSSTSDAHAARLRHVVLVAVHGRDRREFRAFCRLAASVSDDWLVDQLEQRTRSGDPRSSRHAAWVLDAIFAANH
jgi:hypothetical protein